MRINFSSNLIVRHIYFDIVVNSLNYCIKNKSLELYAWCIIPSHIHLIISSEKGKLSDKLRDFKRHTSKELLKSIEGIGCESRREWILWLCKRAGKKNPNNEHYQFWQQINHPIELSTNVMLQQRLDYLHNNPVESGFVGVAEHYLYSSAIDYSGGKGGLIDIIYAS